jgi:hypothetical protein
VIEQKDKTKAEIEAYLRKTAKDMDSSYNAFVCFFLSHGGKDEYMCGSDGKGVNIRELAEMFDGDHCKVLAGKPKLFFAQVSDKEKLAWTKIVCNLIYLALRMTK